MSKEPILINSPLSRDLSSGSHTVSIEIYRLDHEASWALEIVDEFNNSTVWDDTFPTDAEALTEAKKAILEEKITTFIGPKPTK